MISEKFVLLGALFSLVGSTTYVIATLKGKIQPNRVSWFLWALAPMIAFAAEIYKGVGIQALMTFMVGFGPALVLLSSFAAKRAVWKLGVFDFICGGLSLVGLALWALTREGNVAISFSILADGLAALPTVAKSYKYPETESYIVYLFATINASLTLLTINNWTFANYGFPIYIFLSSGLIFILVKFKIGKVIQGSNRE